VTLKSPSEEVARALRSVCCNQLRFQRATLTGWTDRVCAREESRTNHRTPDVWDPQCSEGSKVTRDCQVGPNGQHGAQRAEEWLRGGLELLGHARFWPTRVLFIFIFFIPISTLT
jgi:hypothetical protein